MLVTAYVSYENSQYKGSAAQVCSRGGSFSAVMCSLKMISCWCLATVCHLFSILELACSGLISECQRSNSQMMMLLFIDNGINSKIFCLKIHKLFRKSWWNIISWCFLKLNCVLMLPCWQSWSYLWIVLHIWAIQWNIFENYRFLGQEKEISSCRRSKHQGSDK